MFTRSVALLALATVPLARADSSGELYRSETYPSSCIPTFSDPSYCFYECTSQLDVDSYSSSLTLTPWTTSTSGCYCNALSATRNSTTSATGSTTYNGISVTFALSGMGNGEVDMQYTFTGYTTCYSTYTFNDGCILGTGGYYSNTCGNIGSFFWWYWGIPLIVVIVIASSVGSAVRYRRIRAMRLANATIVTTAPATNYVAFGNAPVVATTNVPVAIAVRK